MELSSGREVVIKGRITDSDGFMINPCQHKKLTWTVHGRGADLTRGAKTELPRVLKTETPRLKDCRLVTELRISWFLGSLATPYLC